MKQIVLTVVGPDESGLVKKVSNIVMEHQGNWLASNLSHLAGYFAGIIQVEMPEDKLQSLTEALAPIEHVSVHEGSFDTDDNFGEQLKFVITGNDRPGIVNELSSIIKHKGANIVQFVSSRQSAPNWGVPLFNAIATIELPVGLSKDTVVEALESIAADLIVDIERPEQNEADNQSSPHS